MKERVGSCDGKDGPPLLHQIWCVFHLEQIHLDKNIGEKRGLQIKISLRWICIGKAWTQSLRHSLGILLLLFIGGSIANDALHLGLNVGRITGLSLQVLDQRGRDGRQTQPKLILLFKEHGKKLPCAEATAALLAFQRRKDLGHLRRTLIPACRQICHSHAIFHFQYPDVFAIFHEIFITRGNSLSHLDTPQTIFAPHKAFILLGNFVIRFPSIGYLLVGGLHVFNDGITELLEDCNLHHERLFDLGDLRNCIFLDELGKLSKLLRHGTLRREERIQNATCFGLLSLFVIDLFGSIHLGVLVAVISCLGVATATAMITAFLLDFASRRSQFLQLLPPPRIQHREASVIQHVVRTGLEEGGVHIVEVDASLEHLFRPHGLGDGIVAHVPDRLPVDAGRRQLGGVRRAAGGLVGAELGVGGRAGIVRVGKGRGGGGGEGGRIGIGIGGLLLLIFDIDHLLGRGPQMKGVRHEFGIVLGESAELVRAGIVLGILLEVEGDLSATAQSVAAGILGNVEGIVAVGGLPYVLGGIAGMLGGDGDAIGHEEGGVESDTELSNLGDVGRAIADAFHELGRARSSHGAEILGQVLLGHANAAVADGQRLVLFVVLDPDLQLLLVLEKLGLGHRQKADLVQGI
mmetsp:Transcript_26948/g.77716  ORF Transcript_26948/g.77716 Transcript_26948/m.77716 type:complete len:633 (+) Transcript_26948:4935-6833(+)